MKRLLFFYKYPNTKSYVQLEKQYHFRGPVVSDKYGIYDAFDIYKSVKDLKIQNNFDAQTFLQ